MSDSNESTVRSTRPAPSVETGDRDGPSFSPARPPRRALLPRAARLPQGADVWAQVRKLALRQLDRLAALEPKVLRGESSKPVHDLRVASRRVQSFLDLLYPAPRTPEIRKLRRKLRRARRTLGELRNFDVLLARTERALARKRTARRPAWEAAHDYIQGLRRKAAARTFRKLARLNLADLYVRLRGHLVPPEPETSSQLIAFPDEQSGDLPPDFAARFSGRLGELWQDLAARTTDSQRDAAALHALRIAAKRLRYLIETAAQLEVPGSADALGWLRKLQQELGDWHDIEVLCGTLIEMVARREFLEARLEVAIEVEKLLLSLRRSKARSCDRYLRDAFDSVEYRRTADWVGQLTASRALPSG